MRSIALSILLAFTAALVLTRLARALALRWGALDRPDGHRKLHRQPVPVWGGIAVYLAFMLGAICIRQVALIGYSPLYDISGALLVAAGLLCLLGLVDDSWDLNGRLKLLLQIVSMTPIVLAGYYIRDISLFGQSLHLGWWGLPLTLLFLVSCINSLNLLDGMDGMASVVGIVAATAIGLTAYLLGHQHVAVMSMLLVGALSGFLCFNRPPASIYLGDSGSTTVGLLLGVVALEGFRTPTGSVPLLLATTVLALPAVDTALAITRRRLTGRRFDAADRGHIHHRLQSHGRSVASALTIVALLGGVAGIGAMAGALLGSDLLALAAVCGVVILAAWRGWFAGHELELLSNRLASPWLTHRWRPSPARFTAIAGEFDTAWQHLVTQVAHWPTDHLELTLFNGDGKAIARHAWQRDDADEASGHYWHMMLTFCTSQSPGATCSLRIAGHDAASSEPAYLPKLASVLQAYGQYWAQNFELVPTTTLRYFDGAEQIALDERRAA